VARAAEGAPVVDVERPAVFQRHDVISLQRLACRVMVTALSARLRVAAEDGATEAPLR
jgi:hypothetical protein